MKLEGCIRPRVGYRWVSRALACLCIFAGGISVFTAPALAARGHVFCNTCTVYGPGTGDGELNGPQGLAVNESSGDVYVADRGSHRIERFTAHGSFIAVWGWGVSDGVGEYEVCTTACQAGTAGSGEGQLSLPGGVAVDNDPSSPSHDDVYVADAGNESIEKFSATGAYIGQLKEASPGELLSGITGVSVDPNGELWVAYTGGKSFSQKVADFNDAISNGFIAGRQLTSEEGAFLNPGFAVATDDNLYVDLAGYGGEGLVMEFDSNGAVLNERFEREESSGDISGIGVEATSGDVYVDNLTTVARFGPEGTTIEEFGSGHLTGGTGVGVNGSTETVYVADPSTDVVDAFTPVPPGPPTVESEWASDVASSSATFSTQINPDGESAEYHFEYDTLEYTPNGPEHGPAVPLPAGAVGSGCAGAGCFEVQQVSVHVQHGLSPGKPYYFRVVAHNNLGTVYGPEQAFTTRPATVGNLPDGRQWEMVSPPDKHGAALRGAPDGPGVGGTIEAAADGGAITYLATGPVEPGAEGEPTGQFVQLLSWSGANGKWSTHDIATRHEAMTGSDSGYDAMNGEYPFFSEDLAFAVAEPAGATLLSPLASERTPYLRSQALCESPAAAAECFTPLATAKEGSADVTSGAAFGVSSGDPLYGEVATAGATPDLRDVVLYSGVPLRAGETGPGLYEWSAAESTAARLQPVGVLPEGQRAACAGLGAGSHGAGNGGDDVRGAISNDGSRIVWTETEGSGCGETHLYLRDMAKRQTVQLDVVQNGASGGASAPDPVFQTANAAGSRVFFTDDQALTTNSGATEANPDLYVCEIVEVAGVDECTPADLTPGSPTRHADVQGQVVGIAEDGTYVYFVADGALAANATQGTCRTPAEPSELCNLYVEHYNGREWESPRLVAELSGEDANDWAPGVAGPIMTARVSPDGHWLTFMSDRSLTSYDNSDAVSGKPDEEVYLYDDAKPGRVVCASCDPTGARPAGVLMESSNARLVDGAERWHGRWLAASLPEWEEIHTISTRYQPRYLSNSGRLFFNSPDELVSQAKNGAWNVYEYEPAGFGSCTESSATYGTRSGGCVAPISSGESSEESAFLDASESGEDAFFLTSAKLTQQDTESVYNLYDAHVCKATSPCPTQPASTPAACESAPTCKAPRAAATSLVPLASLTLSGVGNLAPQVTGTPNKETAAEVRAELLRKALNRCKKKLRRSRKKRRKSQKMLRKARAACERQARARYGAKARAKGSKAKRVAAGRRGK